MKLIQDRNPGAFAVSVPCVHPKHQGPRKFRLSEGYADIEGAAFKDYYCATCARRFHYQSIQQEETSNG